jgi:hypothetical protein
MLDHLIDFEPEVEDKATGFVPLEKAGITETVDAKASTAEWLKSLGAVDETTAVDQAQAQAARESFANIVAAKSTEITQASLAGVTTPQAVQHLVGMLSAYDWEFVTQAQKLRGYAVAKILEEVENPSANIRLKALALLGKVTEVGLFTEKIEVKKTDLTEAEIDAKLKEKLAKFMDIQDAEVIDIEEVQKPKNPDEQDIDPENPDAC